MWGITAHHGLRGPAEKGIELHSVHHETTAVCIAEHNILTASLQMDRHSVRHLSGTAHPL